ncbi:MAG: protein kinase [Sedimentisphaerales bacterium]
MAQENQCPQCGANLPLDAPEGLCPKCLMKAVQPNDVNATLEESHLIEGPGTKIGRYELLSLIGEGGMGMVYVAEQKEPVKRRVALKIVKPGMDSRQVVARFEAERQALALLDHPNIAHVFDAGTTEAGLPYFVMEYVKGMSITAYCDEYKLNIEQRLKLFEHVCEGIHHAHQKGIIHRDIKPSNILVSVHGDRAVPKIIDFGIAKATARSLTDKTVFTCQGQLLGTPEYMSPEQVDLATQDIDTRSDIYSLGVLLYELLAGVLPFEEKLLRSGGLAEIQRTIREQEPATPSIRLTNLGQQAKTIATSRGTQAIALARRLHRELEWIPLKAMRKDRCRRYRSASEMADDIQNYLNGSPLIAGPETAVYRAKKFVHKHAGSVVTVALVAIAIVLGLIFSTAMYLRSEKALEREAVARTQAEQAEEVAEERSEDYRRGLYVNTIQLADAKYHEGNIGNTRRLLESCPNDLRGWEWDRLNHILDQSLTTFVAHEKGLYSMALSPDGKRIVTGGWENAVKIWDIATGKELITLPRAHAEYTSCVAFSPDGKRIVSDDDSGVINIWDINGVNEVAKSIRHGNDWISSVSFSPDGKQLVSVSSSSKEIKVWDTVTGAEIIAFSGNAGGGAIAAFSPDGKHIVSAGVDGAINIYDSASGNEVMTLKGNNRIYAVSFSSDGKLLASGCINNTIKIWDAKTGAIVMTLRGHNGPINSVAFSPDGNYLVSGSWDGTVRVWDIATGRETMTLRGHQDRVYSVVFTPDSKQIISGSEDGTVKVWDVTVNRELTEFLGHESVVGSVVFSPDGRRLVSRSIWDGKVKIWDVASAAEIMTLSGGSYRIDIGFDSIALSSDGKRIASIGAEHAIVVWDAETGVEVKTLGGQDESIYCLAFSSDGKRIVSGSSEGEIKLWDVKIGEEIMTWVGGGNGVFSVDFSPDGQRIVSGHRNGIVKVWDAASGAKLMNLIGHRWRISSMAFSPDGKRLVTGSVDKTARIWDVVTGKELMTLRGHGAVVRSVAFSPDSKRIVTGSVDGTARIWDSSTGAELLTLRANCGAFSPDGKAIAGGTAGNSVVLWESAVPAGGYEARKVGMAARKLVDELHEQYRFYSEVINKLKMNEKLDDSVRKIALQIANSRLWEDEEKTE